MSKIDGWKIAKVVLAVAGVGVTLAQGFMANRDLDEKVAEKVAEALEDK